MVDEIRLPVEHGDFNEWGRLLLDYLRVSHNENGTNKFPFQGAELPVELQSLPNGDGVYTFNGIDTYLEAPDFSGHSIRTTGYMSVEAWISPSVLEWPNPATDKSYVHWIGKGETGKHEWAGRMYSLTTPDEDPQRPNRISAYAFPNAGGFGQGTYFQQSVIPGGWLHVVFTYSIADPGGGLTDFPGSVRAYPGDYGRIRIYRDGNMINESHFSNYHGEHEDVADVAHDAAYILANDYVIDSTNNTAPLRIGSRDGIEDSGYFAGRIAKVAVYNRELTEAEIQEHYVNMMEGSGYDALILSDTPVSYWTLANGTTGLEDQISTNDLVLGDSLVAGDVPVELVITSFTIREDGNAVFEGSLTTHSNLSISGHVYFGGDIRTRMYRTADGRLKTDADFVSQRSITTYDGEVAAGAGLFSGGPVEFTGSSDDSTALVRIRNTNNTGTGILLQLHPDMVPSGYALYVRRYGDAQARFILRSDGRLYWGPGGSTATDTTLYRNAAGSLRTDTDLLVAGTLTVYDNINVPTYTTGALPSASASGIGSMVYNTSTDRPVWSDGSVWRYADGSAV